MSLQYIADVESHSSGSHSAVLTCRWVTPDLVLTGHLDGWLRAWRAGDGTLVAEVKAHQQSLSSLSVSSDASVVLSSSLDGSIALRDTSSVSGHADRPPPAQGDEADEASSSSSTKTEWEALASCTGTGAEGEHSNVAYVTALHPSASVFATTGRGARVSLHSSSADESFGRVISSQISLANSNRTEFAHSLAFSSTGRLLAVGTSRGQVLLYRVADDLSHLTLAATYGSHALPVRALAFNLSEGADDMLLTGADDGVIALHDVRQSNAADSQSPQAYETNPVAVLRGHRGAITALAPVPLSASSRGAGEDVGSSSSSSNHHLLSSTSSDGTARIWDLRTTPRSCVFASNSQGSALHSISWDISSALPPPPPSSSSQSSPRNGFATGAADGVTRWYRVAGSGGPDL
ncbi:unnamed protein product [Parajaminaea phylloscopi]